MVAQRGWTTEAEPEPAFRELRDLDAATAGLTRDWSSGGTEVIDRSEGKAEIGSWVPAVEGVRARQMPPTLLFVQVPEDRTANRLHLDVSPIDGGTEDEMTRPLGLGATRTDVGQGSDRNWVVMADPEGNE
ncbi:VOC family protein [Streptomyces sp. NPDC060209]|uniref:VOC family protein n=1 Tax=Streptomyces sp. NPDC060209 TaxID=3347073 RepID=UPI003665AA45